MMLNGLTKRMACLALKPTAFTRPRTLSILTSTSTNPLQLRTGSVEFVAKTNLHSSFSTTRTVLQSTAAAPSNDASTSFPDITPNTIITDASGRRFAVVDLLKPSTQKLKPKLVRRRLMALKTYEGRERNIRTSPWRLSLVCRHVTGLPLQEALTQLAFLDKRQAPLVQKVLRRTSNLADIRHGIQMSQLEVAECFATKGSHLKRMKFHGRGRMGVMHHKYAHMRVVLREIDFALKIYTAKTMGEKKRWIERQLRAQEDYSVRKAERDELERLERLAALKQKEEKK